jgi:Tol biopolymer transport system component/DNA-binding winged helix-turn-helix (wHTH) protein
MDETSRSDQTLRFGLFEVDLRAGELRKNGVKLKLQVQPFQLLALLLERPGEVVTREELRQKLWSADTFVDFDHGLNKAINKIREALSDSAENPRFIETLARRGYRFIAPLEGEARAAQHQQAHRRSLKGVAAGLTTLLVGAVALWLIRSTPQLPQGPSAPLPLTSYPGREMFPAFSPDGNQVAFAADKDQRDNLDIYVKLIGSAQPLRLTSHPAGEYSPAWSPDGRQIAFLREQPAGKAAVLLMSALGGPATKLVEIHRASPDLSLSDFFHDPLGPYLAWSVDGSSLVIVDKTSAAEPFSLFLLSIASRQKRRLTSPDARSFGDSNPAFSPDGRTLVFSRMLNWGASNLYQLSLSASLESIGGPKQLTWAPKGAIAPSWSPDGRTVIFSSGPEFISSLWKIALTGDRTAEWLPFAGDNSGTPTLSRRGRRLAYARRTFDQNIWRMEVSGWPARAGQPHSFISTTRAEGFPHFSPDGERIAFASDQSGSDEIWVCDSAASNAVPLTALGGSGTPRWSPDGDWIAFDSNRDGPHEVYIVSANGGQPRRLTTHPSSDIIPSWSRDGKWVYFASNRSGEYQVWKMPVDGGEAIRVTQNGGMEAFESLDGTSVYYAKWDERAASIWNVPVGGGQEVQLLNSIRGLSFALIKKGIYFCGLREGSVGSTIQFFDFATGKTRQMAVTDKPVISGFSASPDGRWILYVQVDQLTSDLMLVEDFH